MLLIHQAGSVKVGEVVRYTVTYTPHNDRILPTPSHLHLKVKNTSAIPLRAAWVHGPYALHVSAYPATFNPHHKVEKPDKDGVPDYEPMVKAGGSWSAKLLVPDDIRETGADLGRRQSGQQQQTQHDGNNVGSVTWVVEIASQILFSNSASVGFEVLVGRDERSLDLGFAAVAGQGHGGPGQVRAPQNEREKNEARRRKNVQSAGVYSKAVKLMVEDTETLWDKPPLPSWEDEAGTPSRRSTGGAQESKQSQAKKQKRKRNVHLVILTHGLHSNLGADMLFLKESIDATVAQAREEAKKRKASYRGSQDPASHSTGSNRDSQHRTELQQKVDQNGTSTAPLSGGQDDLDNAPDEDDEEEETIVRGFNGNAVRTENGIQYLGKRLAKYILRFTYPDQPFLPIKRSFSRKMTDLVQSDTVKVSRDGKPAHQGSTVHTPQEAKKADELPYTFTSISFIGHSLGGLIQTYAIAYIHKHSPTFFQQIQPINFVCLASPMLGLSNENPMYVKFALDFGLVGRTGQDLGLTWRPPTLANKGWNAVIGGFGAGAQKDKTANKQQGDPGAKPLLRILPTGPAHQVLRMFRNRTVYSNVVNDGIVPLRTSCLLFLDWRGLGKVDKARRENGLIGTVAEWGWAELTGQNASSVAPKTQAEQKMDSSDEDSEQITEGQGDDVPLPAENETAEDNKRLTHRVSYDDGANTQISQNGSQTSVDNQSSSGTAQQNKGVWDSVLSFFGSGTSEQSKPRPTSKKTAKTLRRAQTIYRGDADSSSNVSDAADTPATTTNPTMRPHIPHLQSHKSQQQKRPMATRGESMTTTETGDMTAPPKTSIFESAGDILHPPLPGKQWLTDPSTRSRTIFHDRVYHPEDIPPPPTKRSNTRLNLSFNNGSSTSQKSMASSNTEVSAKTTDTTDSSGMKVEEKIARAYHRDLSWRKVLVRLEPDAHNNIIVRRMFANAYGWPVIKHLCDTHFADTHAATTRDEDEPGRERAPPMDQVVDAKTGEEVQEQTAKKVDARTESEMREARDEIRDLQSSREALTKRSRTSLKRAESDVWDDAVFEGSDDEDSDAVDERHLVSRILNPYAKSPSPKKPEAVHHRSPPNSSKSADVAYTDGHRGLAPTSPSSKNAVRSSFDAGDVDAPISPVVASKLVEEPEPLITGAGMPTTPGLRKSVEEQVSPPSSRKGRRQSGKAGSNPSPD